MKTCKICGNPKSKFILNNRTVCIKCDDLVFDLEIECDETSTKKGTKEIEKTITPQTRKTNIPAKKQSVTGYEKFPVEIYLWDKMDF